MSAHTYTISYPPREKRAFRQGDRCNVAVYAPGEPCDALPGSPTFKLWCAVLWFPGTREEYTLHTSESDALRADQ